MNISFHTSWVLWFHPRLFVLLSSVYLSVCLFAVFVRNHSLEFLTFCKVLCVNHYQKLTESDFSEKLSFDQGWSYFRKRTSFDFLEIVENKRWYCFLFKNKTNLKIRHYFGSSPCFYGTAFVFIVQVPCLE